MDWWTVGIFMYELLIGVSPFYHRNKKKMLNAILKDKLVFPDRTKYKINYSDNCMKVIYYLLKKDPNLRLGSKNDSQEILNDPFFKDVDINAILKKQVVPPFKPHVIEDYTHPDFCKYINVDVERVRLEDTFVHMSDKDYLKDHSYLFKDFDQPIINTNKENKYNPG